MHFLQAFTLTIFALIILYHKVYSSLSQWNFSLKTYEIKAYEGRDVASYTILVCKFATEDEKQHENIYDSSKSKKICSTSPGKKDFTL